MMTMIKTILMNNYFIQLLYKPILDWLKYYYVLLRGKVVIVKCRDGEIYNIGPAAIRDLEFNINNICFDCSIYGRQERIIIPRNQIVYYGEEK
jgi:stringent starvation protein B